MSVTKQLTRSRKRGQSLAEYGLILALIGVFCIGALTLLGGNINTILNNLATAIKGVNVTTGTAPAS